ncbi:MAG: hypothetical protein RL701_4296 [Pseudomonadota bacterium]|jgi:hypothetical protein
MHHQDIIVRDRRVELGGVPARTHLTIVNTDAETPLQTVFSTVRSVAHAGAVRSLMIICHGMARKNELDRVSMEGGGMGLLLGRERVTNANVSLWRAIEGCVQNIVVYACRAAQTLPGNEGTGADGRYLMGALAIHARANVYAPDAIQGYQMYKDFDHGRFLMGNWEGNLWKFPRTGVGAELVAQAPTELHQILGR